MAESTDSPKPDGPARAAALAFARHQLWLRGRLRWKLDSCQRGLYDEILASERSRYVLECARRLGKTFLLCVVSAEICLAKPKSRVVYGAPTIKDLAEFILPTLEAIHEDAPESCRGVFDQASGHWRYPNGSYIHLFGCDDKRKANRGRGPGADLVVLDEAGFIPILRYVLRSVLRPQTLTTGGRTILGSTPAEEPDHDFTDLAELAEKNGAYSSRTIYQNPRLSQERIAQYIEDDARDDGKSVEEYMESDDFQREYLAKRVTNKLLVVVPEWEAKADTLIREVERPEFFEGMTMLDMGGADPHAVLFGYWHFPKALLVIEDELLLRGGENTAELAACIKEKERQLWGTSLWEGTLRGLKDNPTPELLANMPEWMAIDYDKQAPTQPFTRWADNDLQMIRDLYALNGILFLPTAKDHKQWQVNNLRLLINSGSIAIHPRCVNLDRHLRSTVWENHKRMGYKRKHGEHGDLLDALVYGARNIDKQRNPFPAHWGELPDTRRRPAPPSVATRLEETYLSGSALGRSILRRRGGTRG